MADAPLHWPRYELIDGELLVSPSPRISHARAVTWLVLSLGNYLARESVGEVAAAPADLQLLPESIVQPDIFVAPGRKIRRAVTWDDVPDLLLAVEVLSPSTARYDRGVKRKLYQRAGVLEYWIVDIDAHLIERWRPADLRPEIITGELVWNPPAATSALTLDLAALWDAADPEPEV